LLRLFSKGELALLGELDELLDCLVLRLILSEVGESIEELSLKFSIEVLEVEQEDKKSGLRVGRIRSCPPGHGASRILLDVLGTRRHSRDFDDLFK
jgi:hypothetical protein